MSDIETAAREWGRARRALLNEIDERDWSGQVKAELKGVTALGHAEDRLFRALRAAGENV